jgi:hypothetical protein
LKKTISIITVVKNAENLIEDTINSVLNQKAILNNELALEYLIHDGNSNDKTFKIIKKFSKNPNIIISSYRDNGLYDSLSSLIKKTTGDYIAYINAGDLFNLNAFTIINEIFSDDKIKWVTGGRFFYNQKNEITDFSFCYKYRQRLIKKGVYGRYLPFIQQESTFWKRELIKNIDYKYLSKLKYSGDMYLWNCFSKNNKLFTINSHLGGFKYHENQLTYRETGNTTPYINESKKFSEKINLIDIILILLDSIPWLFLKYSQNLIRIYNSDSFIYADQRGWKLEDKNYIKYASAWACEINDNQGEGVLGKKFIIYLLRKGINIKLKTFFKSIKIDYIDTFEKNIIIENKYQKNIFESYIYPFIGLFYLWKEFLLGRKTIYVNYLPLWNFILLLLLPPKTLLGPITGGKYSGSIKNLNSLLRKYLFPFLYCISIVILKFRYDKIFFSTEVFKKDTKHYLKNKKKYFNFYSYDAFDGITNKTFVKKNIDFLIYYRIHPNKNNIFIKDILEKIKEDFIVKIIGDNPFIDKIEYLGILNKNQLNNYLQKTKFTILSGENTSSLFFLDCINNNVSIFYNKESIPSYDLFKIKPSSLFPIDYKNTNQSLKEIYQIVPNEKLNIKKYNLKKINF